MIKTVVIKIRMDFNGNRLDRPEIIKILPNSTNCLDKAAKIYARMIRNELAAAEDELTYSELDDQKSERKSC